MTTYKSLYYSVETLEDREKADDRLNSYTENGWELVGHFGIPDLNIHWQVVKKNELRRTADEWDALFYELENIRDNLKVTLEEKSNDET